MAKKVVKKAKATGTPKKSQESAQSMIIQAGIIVILVASIMICSYAISLYM